MKENRIYSCPYCKAILVLPKANWQKTIKCTVCDMDMRLLDDDFDLAEIIEENNDDDDGRFTREI